MQMFQAALIIIVQRTSVHQLINEQHVHSLQYYQSTKGTKYDNINVI